MAGGARALSDPGGAVPPVLMVIAVVAAGAEYPRYRHRAAMVSELGTSASPRARGFNAAWAVAGALIGLYAWGLWWLVGLPVVTGGVGILAAGTLVSGLFPCEPGCPPSPRTTSGRIHALAGLLAVLGAVVACLALGFWAADRMATWGLTLYSLITGGAGLALLFTTLGAIGTGFEGFLQRVFLLGILAWLGVTAVLLPLRLA
ncbi:DUF998 domain-containing protein [Thiohalorhabdus sp.]|uniref:DUF998 domain-containing protein n=1 Tax=Thiohalorhabdus sp. TaxID=3094134 RepID=UPI002FC2D8C9